MKMLVQVFSVELREKRREQGDQRGLGRPWGRGDAASTIPGGGPHSYTSPASASWALRRDPGQCLADT